MWSERTLVPRGPSGYSLLEVVVVLSLVSLAAALFSSTLLLSSRDREVAAAAREMCLCLRSAHWKAVVSGRRRRIFLFTRPGDAALRYVIEKEDGGGWRPDGDGHRIPAGMELKVKGPATKVFNPDGTSSIGSYTLQTAAGKSYRLSLSPLTGRVRLYRGDDEVGGEG